MTPTEKAKQLFDMFDAAFENDEDEHYVETVNRLSKEFAIIVIDELIRQNGELYLNGIDSEYYMKKNAYLFEVKGELINMEK